MGMGRKNLKTAQTKLNENSSRSHAIFTIKIVKVSGKLATVTQLSFCDLAGTERAQRTENTGQRMKESQNINKDLHHLKECIEALKKYRPGKVKKELVPYRNCKLTRLFRSFFSGKGTASLILNISQCASDFDETVQAIRFGSSAMRIMIPMTKRESILIQPPQFYRTRGPIQKSMVSVVVEDNYDDAPSLIEEESDNGSDEENITAAPSTVKKRPLQKSDDTNRTRVIGKATKSDSTTKKVGGKTKKISLTRTFVKNKGKATPEEEASSNSASEFHKNGNGLDTHDENDDDTGTSSAYDESKSDDEIEVADLTLGHAIRGEYDIADDFWIANCPFPDMIHVEDHIVRGLLLLLGKCQEEIKQLKARNMTNEMKVRRELCDFYEKERIKHEKEHQRHIKKIRDEFDADLARQLGFQKDAMERQHTARGDPSLLSFESHENDIEKQILREELLEKDKLIKELQEKLDSAA